MKHAAAFRKRVYMQTISEDHPHDDDDNNDDDHDDDKSTLHQQWQKVRN